MNKVLDADDVIRGLREVVAEQGPNKRAGGIYEYREGTPCCIVGHVMVRNGFRIESHNEGGVNGAKIGMTVGGQRPYAGALTLNAINVLGAAQEEQDLGLTWGEALAAAEEEYDDISTLVNFNV